MSLVLAFVAVIEDGPLSVVVALLPAVAFAGAGIFAARMLRCPHDEDDDSCQCGR